RSIPVLLDVDTGIDDAMALALALHLPEIELVGVTTVAGNVPGALAPENTRRGRAWRGASDLRGDRGRAGPPVRPRTPAAASRSGVYRAAGPDATRRVDPRLCRAAVQPGRGVAPRARPAGAGAPGRHHGRGIYGTGESDASRRV